MSRHVNWWFYVPRTANVNLPRCLTSTARYCIWHYMPHSVPGNHQLLGYVQFYRPRDRRYLTDRFRCPVNVYPTSVADQEVYGLKYSDLDEVISYGKECKVIPGSSQLGETRGELLLRNCKYDETRIPQFIKDFYDCSPPLTPPPPCSSRPLVVVFEGQGECPPGIQELLNNASFKSLMVGNRQPPASRSVLVEEIADDPVAPDLD